MNSAHLSIEKINVDSEMANSLIEAGWNFIWNDSYNENSLKLAAWLDDELQGLIEYERMFNEMFNEVRLIESAPHNVGKHKIYGNVPGTLFATVAQDAFEQGFDGFVVLEAKSNLINHYILKYGAKLTHGRRLVFDAAASNKLIEEFLNA